MNNLDLEQQFRQFSEETQALFNEKSFILNNLNGDGSGGSGSGGSADQPVTLNVTTFNDQNDGSSVNGLSLRDAILRAQTEREKEYIIYLGAGVYTLFIQGNQDSIFAEAPGIVDNIVTRTGDIDINSRITIIGVDSTQTIIDASSLGDRLFDVRDGGSLTLQNITIKNGQATNITEEDGTIGGGIRIGANGRAIINNSVIADNSTDTVTGGLDSNGGGIANLGSVEINNTLISGNLSGDDAGGIFNRGVMMIQNSTIAGNFASAAAVEVIEAGGGGIYNAAGGTLFVLNSTISGNITGDGGGGILAESSNTIIINTTITNNTAQIGSGILSVGVENEVLLQNTIVAENLDSADIEGFFAQNSANNLIGNGNGIILNGINNNRVGDILSPLDPNLAPLGDNGGLTPTHALLSNSPAINGGDNSFLTANNTGMTIATDQRGFARISEGITDIGSYEYLSEADSLLNTPLSRFQNTQIPGTYLYANQTESQSIQANFPQFKLEGVAFNVGFTANDNLIAMYRFQNTQIPGTYLYANAQESQSIRQNYTNFKEEGLAFYVYGAGSNQGENIYRFQNQSLPGTYLFVNEGEKQNILQNFSNFTEEGIAFKVGGII